MSRIRIGIDTGGTFTDVVAVDEATGRLAATKTPSTPHDPAEGFMTGVHKVLGQLGLGGDAVTAVSHGTTVATNKLLEGKVENLGFITTEGYEFMLEIARQSVPDGYGNSYFWVKPDRIVPAHRVKTVGGRLAVDGSEIRPFDAERAREVAGWFRDQGINTIGVCFLHSYAQDAHELAMRAILDEVHPEATVSISSEVLREYREYERSVTTLVDAAVKPNIRRYVANIARRLDELDARAIPFYVMKSNGGVLSAEEVVHQPITTVLSGPAAGALGAAVVAERAGFDQVVTCDGGGTSTDVTVVIDGRPALTTEGHVGAYPSKIPMIDVVTVGAGGGSIAWISPEGTLKVGPQSAGADPGPICYGHGGEEPTITDAHAVLGRIPPHLLGGEVPLDVPLADRGIRILAERLGLGVRGLRDRGAGDLRVEPGQRAASGHRQPRPRRARLRDGHLRRIRVAAGLPAGRHPRAASRAGAAQPRATSLPTACSPSTSATTTCRPRSPGSRSSTPTAVQAVVDDLARPGRRRAGARGVRRRRAAVRPTADLRYYGQAYEVRVDVPDGDGHRRPRRRRRCSLPRRAPGALLLRQPRRPPSGGRVGQPPGHRHRPDPQARAARGRCRSRCGVGAHRHPVGLLRRLGGDPRLRPGQAGRRGPRRRPGGVRGVQLHGAAAPRLRGPGGRLRQPGDQEDGMSVDPILVEIVEGYLASVEQEVETAIGRTSRSPMIRDAHDYRAGIHDRRLRKLTGRSYSRAGAPGGPGLPDRDHEAGGRVLPQRRLPLRGRHRPPARPLRHGSRSSTTAATGRRWSRSCRRSATTTTSVAPYRDRCPARPPASSRRA